MVDYYIHLWPLENSSPEHTKVNATKYTSDLHLSTLLEKLPSKMDQHAKPNITVNKQEVHNKNCRAQVSSIQQRRVAERHIFEPNLVQISNFTLSTRRNGQIHNLKIQDASCRHFGFLGYVK